MQEKWARFGRGALYRIGNPNKNGRPKGARESLRLWIVRKKIPACSSAWQAGVEASLLCARRFRIGTSPRGHIEQVVSHPMLQFLFLQRVVMNHDHFVVILLCHRKPLAILIDLVRLKLEEGAVQGDVW